MPALDPVAAFGDPDESRFTAALARLAHLLPAAAAAYLVTAVLRWVRVLPAEGWGEVVIIVFGVLWIAAAAASSFHRVLARICLACMQEVPADAPVRASKVRPLLRIAHLIGGPRLLPIVCCALLAVGLARQLLHLTPQQSLWLSAPITVGGVAVSWAEWIHHRYRPWCPYCRRWDDGSGPREPSPDPTTSGTKTRA